MTAKMNRFCEEYLLDLNGTQAAIRAGYSKRTAYAIAEQNLRKPEIAKRVKELMDARSERTKITADKVVNELASLGFYNVKDLITDNNSIVTLSDMERDVLKPIVGIKVTEQFIGKGEDVSRIVTTDVKLSDKISALEKLGRHLGIFAKDNRQQGARIKITRTKESD